MKRIISASALCAFALCTFTSCAGDLQNDTEIVGKWSFDDRSELPDNIDGFGFIFSEDGKGSIYEDISSLMHFTNNGLDIGGTVFGDEFLNASGDVISFDVAGQEFLTMSRLTFGNSRYDGVYTLTGGMLYDNLAAGMASSNGVSTADMNVTLEFDGSHSEIILNDVFNYTARGKILTIEGMTGFFDTNGKGYLRYSIDGDKLTTKGKETETLTRVQ